MKNVLVVVGYGPGISNAVARKFGAAGFAVALVSRNRERLDAGVTALQAAGIEAAAFVADAGDPTAIRQAIADVRATLGPITVLEWTPYGTGAGDLTTASADEIRAVLDVPILGLTAAIQAALPDLRQRSDSAVLVTNGGLGLFTPESDRSGVDWNVMGLSIANAAKHKLVRLLALKLEPAGVYVGEVVVASTVKGSAFDNGSGTLEAARVADEFWTLYTTRHAHSVVVS